MPEGTHHDPTAGLGLKARLLWGWKGSERRSCSLCRAWGENTDDAERRLCVLAVTLEPQLGRGARHNDFFHGKTLLCKLRTECLNRSPLGKSQDARQGLCSLALCGASMTCLSSRDATGSPSAWASELTYSQRTKPYR